MIWSEARRFCFIHVSKAGGTAIERAYARHMVFGDVILDANPQGMNRLYREKFGIGKHATAHRVARLVGRDRFRAVHSVAVLRDPLDRMLSYHRWVHGFVQDGETAQRLKPFTDLEAFVREAAPPALPLQASMVRDPRTRQVIVSRLIRYEALAEGWAAVCRRLGIAGELPRANVSPRVDVEVTDAARALVREIYAEDYRLLDELDAARRPAAALAAAEEEQRAEAQA
jgi:Sulfotransferase family